MFKYGKLTRNFLAPTHLYGTWSSSPAPCPSGHSGARWRVELGVGGVTQPSPTERVTF